MSHHSNARHRHLPRNRFACVLPLVLTLALPALLQADAVKPCDLMKMLSSTDPETVERGIRGFVDMGENAATPLVCFLAGKAPGFPNAPEYARRNGEEALVRIGSPVVPPLLGHLNTPDESLRARLVRVLGRIKDVRRDKPLMALWTSEKSDRVRAALVGAIVALKSTLEEALDLLRARVPTAANRELTALCVQFAMHGTDRDLEAVLERVGPARRSAFITGVVRELKELKGDQARKAIARLEALR